MASYLPQPWRRVPTTSALSSISDHHGAGGSEYLNTSLTSGIPSSQSAASGASAADSPPALSTASAARSQELELRHLLEGTLANVRGELHLAEEGAKGRGRRPLSGSIPASSTPAPTHGPEEAAASREGARAIRHDLRRLEDETSAERGDGGQRLVLGERRLSTPSWILSQRP